MYGVSLYVDFGFPRLLAPLRYKQSSRKVRRVLAARAMMKNRDESNAVDVEHSRNPSSNPKVEKIQKQVNEDPKGWDKCWEHELTPWDLKETTPIIKHLIQTGDLPKGRGLVPGCGTGYDVVEMASPDRYIVGLDISENAIKKAKERASLSPNIDYFSFVASDFFTWHPSEPFDFIFDYTFFCALDPSMRFDWASKMADILKPDGELITLMFPISDHIGGPPYKVSVQDYEEVLHPIGFQAISVVDNEFAVERRKGREKLGRWKKLLNESRL